MPHGILFDRRLEPYIASRCYLRSNVSAERFITHKTRILFRKAHLYKSIRFIFTCEKSRYSQSEWRTAISHVEV